MIPISTAVLSGFTFSANWHGFELKLNENVVATLKHPRLWSSDFVAETSSQRWIIQRRGFWGSKGEIMDAASQHPVAEFKSALGGKGTLQFADGQAFHVEAQGWWHPVWRVATKTGEPVLDLHTRVKSVVVHEEARVESERLVILILFTLYRIRQAEEAAAAASAAAS